MYHTHFRGTHYHIGYSYGSALKKHGNYILKQVPWPIGPDQISFAAACRPFYQDCFPEILEEIQGLADGQGCPASHLETVLFCMYCMVPSCHCSHFAVRNRTNVLFGRNSDFLTCIEKLYTNSIYHFAGNSYAFQGNTTAFVEMEDGINEHGLAIGLTMVPSRIIRPGIHAGMLLRMILEKCTNVQEACELIEKIPLASGQTFLMADQNGTIALVECGPFGMDLLIPENRRLSYAPQTGSIWRTQNPIRTTAQMTGRPRNDTRPSCKLFRPVMTLSLWKMPRDFCPERMASSASMTAQPERIPSGLFSGTSPTGYFTGQKEIRHESLTKKDERFLSRVKKAFGK